jgi:ankyrin repeat protein
LLKWGADVNARTEDSWTPLHSACNWACTKAASTLIQNGACVNAQTKGKQTPLHLAAANREAKDVLEMLLMNKLTDTSIRNGAGDTARDICERSSALCALFEMRDESVDNLYGDKG